MNESEYITMYHAEDTHWWYVSLHNLILRSIPHNSRPLAIYDAGCGTGRLLQLLSDHGTGKGCDASEAAVRFCQKRGLTTVVHADLNTMTLEKDRYDVITSIDVLYHANIGDERAVLQKMYDALKSGGVLILQVPAYEWLRSNHDRAVHTRRRYLRPEVVAMLRDSGFIIEKATYRLAFLLPPIAMIRLGQRFLRRKGGRTNPVSDVTRPPNAVNALLRAVMSMENLLLKRASFPFGTSVFAVARKPDRILRRTAKRSGNEHSTGTSA